MALRSRTARQWTPAGGRPDRFDRSFQDLIFLGDGKRYKQGGIAHSSQAKPDWQAEWVVWSARVKVRVNAAITLTPKELHVTSRPDEKRPL